jgi:hypothetical protein
MDDPGVDAQEIADRLELGELLARYIRAVDGGDWALLDSVFTADAVIDFSATGGIRGVGRTACKARTPAGVSRPGPESSGSPGRSR